MSSERIGVGYGSGCDDVKLRSEPAAEAAGKMREVDKSDERII